MSKLNNKNYVLYLEMVIGIVVLGVFFINTNKEKQSEENKNIQSAVDSNNDVLNKKIENMSIDEKIGQMLIAGFNGTNTNEEVKILVNDLQVGGVILFSRNIENSNQLKSLTQGINDINKNIPLFISIDEEGGRVSRLPDDVKNFESAMEIGNRGSVEYAFENGESLGERLKNHNINMDFAPVLDIFSNPKNTVIGDRAFGSNPKIVSDMGIATMLGLQSQEVIPVVKHFPGHGDTEVDSHYGLPIVTKSIDELEKFELIPFEKAINKGCDAVMVSHIVMEKIDDKNPTTLSKKVITNLLREQLGFNGVVVTDDMLMKAITDNISIEEASIKTINAGSDIVLIGSDVNTVKSVKNAIKLAIENNEISMEEIDKSVYRILKLKDKYNLN